jgi:NAD(P)-dependent dehydrogenase (short-subunit alcohol dehydrogenase family)
MVKAAINKYARIDVLVNAAAVLVYGTAVETDEVCWQRVLATNLTGTFLCAKAVLPYMIRQGGGCIINFSSTAGAHDAIEHGVAYCASKGGVMALTKAMAVDHACQNIRVNSICPGPTDTPMLRNVLSPHQLEEFARTYPMGRLAKPEELANAALFLASDEASFVTGLTMFVDGGQSALL